MNDASKLDNIREYESKLLLVNSQNNNESNMQVCIPIEQINNQQIQDEIFEMVDDDEDEIEKQDEMIILKTTSLSKLTHTSSELICRICHIEESSHSTDDFIVPCNCKGSLRVVHESCLLKWLAYNRN
jgi:hypothetical protein